MLEQRTSRYVAKKIMVFSTKGGAGKSFIAVNLAIDLYNQSKKIVTLFDMDYKSADDAAILNINPQKTIHDIVQNIDNLNYELLDSVLIPHFSGIQFLAAPINSMEAEYIDTESTIKVIDMLSEISDYIVIDTPAFFSDNVISLLEKVNYLCIVMTMDILSIKNLKESLFILKQLRFPRNKILLILNRANSRVGLTIGEVENRIMEKIDVTIPSDRLVPLSINEGIPIAIKTPKSQVSQSVSKLTQLLI